MHLRNVQIYAGGVVAAGLITMLMVWLQWHCLAPERFLVCLALALLGATFRVKIPGLDSSISPSFVPLFLALGTMSWGETVAMAALAGLMQSIKVPRLTLLQIAFNAANLALATAAAYVIAHGVAEGSVALYLVAATVFQAVNIAIVSGVLSLASNGSLASIWKNCHFWSYPYHLTGAALAAVWIQAENATTVGSMALLLAVALYLMSVFYGEVAKRGAATAA